MNAMCKEICKNKILNCWRSNGIVADGPILWRCQLWSQGTIVEPIEQKISCHIFEVVPEYRQVHIDKPLSLEKYMDSTAVPAGESPAAENALAAFETGDAKQFSVM